MVIPEKYKKTLLFKVLKEVKGCIKDIWGRIKTFINSIRLLFREYGIEKELGIDTTGTWGVIGNYDFYDDTIGYMPTPYYVIDEVLDYLKLGSKDVFMDLGCGKGRVLFYTGLKGVKKVVGVESDPEAYQAACDNMARLRKKFSPIEIINQDAAEADTTEVTVFFMYNPFMPRTMRQLLEKIRLDLSQNPRRIQIVYYNALQHKILDEQDWLRYEGKFGNMTKFRVWKNIV